MTWISSLDLVILFLFIDVLTLFLVYTDFIVIISFFFECCLLYSLSPYSVVLFFFFFFTCISIVCVCVCFFNKQRPFFGLLNMRCLKEKSYTREIRNFILSDGFLLLRMQMDEIRGREEWESLPNKKTNQMQPSKNMWVDRKKKCT